MSHIETRDLPLPIRICKLRDRLHEPNKCSESNNSPVGHVVLVLIPNSTTIVTFAFQSEGADPLVITVRRELAIPRRISIHIGKWENQWIFKILI